jgi:hypothetical protein
MYGWINNIIEKFVLSSLNLESNGNELWQSIKVSAICDVADDRWEFCKAYPDELTFRLLAASSVMLDIAESSLLESLGSYLITYSR